MAKRWQVLLQALALFTLIQGLAYAQTGTPEMINFQGELLDSDGNPRVGTFSITFTIFNDPVEGDLLWTESQPSITTSSTGEFNVLLGSVTPIEYAIFSDTVRYLEIQISPDPAMLPRIRLVTSSYAFKASRVYSVDAAVGGAIAGSLALSNDLTVAGLASVGSFRMNSGASNGAFFISDASGNAAWQSATSLLQYWRLEGNMGTNPETNFLGTIDGVGIELRVGNITSLRLKFNGIDGPYVRTPDVIGGSSFNVVKDSAWGCFIGGGGDMNGTSNNGHKIFDSFCTIGGGLKNITGYDSQTQDDQPYATIGGGFWNRSLDSATTISGGYDNVATESFSTVSGGNGNVAGGYCAHAAGGYHNEATGNYSFAAGNNSVAAHDNCFVWNGSSVPFFSGSDSTFLIRAPRGVGINTNNPGTFQLAVEGKIGAREIVVTEVLPWPDYVFDDDYQLIPLVQLEKIVKAERHLPGLPSADEIGNEGVNIGNNQAALLQKVEELTLYLIELNKENEGLKNRVRALETRIEQR